MQYFDYILYYHQIRRIYNMAGIDQGTRKGNEFLQYLGFQAPPHDEDRESDDLRQ